MAGRRNGRRPLCRATLRDGRTSCANHAEAGGYCARHTAELDDAPDEELVDAAVHLAVETEKLPETEQPGESGTNGGAPAETRLPPVPGELRERFREDAASNYQVLVDALLEGLKETQSVFLDCPCCGRRHAHSMPALGGRAKAVETLVSLGYGRPAPEQAVPDVEAAVAVLRERVGDEDISRLSAAEVELLLLLHQLEHPDLIDDKVRRVREVRALVAERGRTEVARTDEGFGLILAAETDRNALERLCRVATELLGEN